MQVISSKERKVIIYFFNNYLLSTHGVTDAGLGTKGIVGNETSLVLQSVDEARSVLVGYLECLVEELIRELRLPGGRGGCFRRAFQKRCHISKTLESKLDQQIREG